MSLLLARNATISIDVKFYDDQEEEDFGKWANATDIKSIAGQTIQIPGAEFLAYFLIHKKDLSPLRYPDLDAVKANIKQGNKTLREWVDFDGTTLHVKKDTDKLEKGFAEHLGEAAGLAVANRIHRLNEADWVKIPEISGKKGRKTHDWEYASDGKKFVEVETKGSLSDRVDLLTGLSGHKASIKAKKEDSEKTCHPRFNKHALRYGTITSISKDPKSVLTVRLVDPEGNAYDRTPREAQVLKRLAWASWVIRLIAGRTHLSVALQNRLATLVQTHELPMFEGLSLRGGTGKTMPGQQFIDRFFTNRTTARTIQAAGVLTSYNSKHLLFIGLSRLWFLPIIRQKFDDISSLAFEPGSEKTMVDCVLSAHQLNEEFSDMKKLGVKTDGNYSRFQRTAILHQSPAGMVFGLVPKSAE